ncbi:MAG: HD domain-containing protein [Syntrophaceae bacterium]|nr:HD domain-containing protein [Syntrophaceae bacterium]
MDGIELLKKVKGVDRKMMVIMMTSYPEIDLAVQAMRLGAFDFIIKPVELDMVVLSVRRALERKRLEEEVELYQNRLERLVSERTAKIEEAYHVLKNAHLASVNVLVGAIDAKDPYTRGHSDRVRRMSVSIGSKLGFDEKRLESLEYGALLHDIGKIGIRDEVLQKRGPLSPEDYQNIQKHPLIGVKIVKEIEFFKDKIPMIRQHHEHFDGSGYPDGLVGEAIPLEARIIAVADTFDVLTSGRPGRKGMIVTDVLMEMEGERGKKLDPHILQIFFDEKIYLISQ